MSESVALGSGPITLTAQQDGRLLLIPLSALTFDANGIIQVTNWPLYNAYKADVDHWLGYLVSIGALTPGATPPPKPAMIIQAADPGGAGNSIQVAFSKITPDPGDPTNAAKTTFDATINETDTYPGLSIDPASPSFITSVLGTQTVIGTRPGLVHVLDAVPPAPPAQLALPLAGTYPLGGGTASKKSSAAVINNDSSGNSFQVEAKKNGLDGNNTTVTICNVDPTAKTFTLVATWTQPTITGIKLADLPGKLTGTGYEITVKPPDGGDFAIPAPGTIGLSGGADAVTASPASGIALAS